MALLQLENVAKHYRLHKSWLFGHEINRAVDGITLSVMAGESFGIVGESGCGKSTLAGLIAMLEPVTAGKIFFQDEDLAVVTGSRRRAVRQKIQIVFQDIYASLNPRFSIGETVSEPIANFDLHKAPGFSLQKRLDELLDMVELSKDMLNRYPAELSGGERQRVGIARSLAANPRLILFDEATSGLDVTLQSQILRLLQRLKRELGLTYLFITHNLQLLPWVTDRVGVMYLGKLVETIASSELAKARHPYTRSLLAATPVMHPRLRRGTKPVAAGEAVYSSKMAGCRFCPRCSEALPQCSESEPGTVWLGEKHGIACHQVSTLLHLKI